MNQELKAIIDMAWTLGIVGMDVVNKQPISKTIVDAQPLLGQVPSVFGNFGQLEEEIKKLPGSEQEKDLIAYVAAKMGVVDTKAEKVVIASMDWAMSTYRLVSAVSG